MFTFAPDGLIINANKTACERLEYTRDELLNMKIAEFDPHYPLERWPEHWEELRQNHKMLVETHLRGTYWKRRRTCPESPFDEAEMKMNCRSTAMNWRTFRA